MPAFCEVPTPSGFFYLAPGRVAWFYNESTDITLNRSTVWLDDGTRHTVLLAAADLAAVLDPPATRTTILKDASPQV